MLLPKDHHLALSLNRLCPRAADSDRVFSLAVAGQPEPELSQWGHFPVRVGGLARCMASVKWRSPSRPCRSGCAQAGVCVCAGLTVLRTQSEPRTPLGTPPSHATWAKGYSAVGFVWRGLTEECLGSKRSGARCFGAGYLVWVEWFRRPSFVKVSALGLRSVLYAAARL